MSHLRRALLLLSLSGFLGGCSDFSFKDLFFVELEEERMCKQLEDFVMPAAPPGSYEVSTVLPFSFPGSIESDTVGSLTLQLTEVTLQTDDNSRFDTIDEAMLAMRPEGATDLSQATMLLAYERQPGAGVQGVQLRGEEVDLTRLNRDGPVELYLQAKGALPNEEWTLRGRACMAFRVRVNYLYLLLPTP
ncbi:hypothetical protein JQX13_41110 [Archangium violaceum]|uniref:hypothetical protein n=1 Tax=Archangium violaceum TaxID=83451 RepID=UPI00193B534E|nr:hypothetical protein [Archangium violaceum]QRK06440.1 hypothetical protein JQX13_41110 [Archangium violaceum]